MKRPLFSCVVPVKGKRPFFEKALESLRSQGMGDELEVIVQDADVEPDGGQSDAFNRGFAKAHGEWFFWLNSDDLLLPGALKKVKEFIRCPPPPFTSTTLEWIVGNEYFIDAEDKVVDCSVGHQWQSWLYRFVVPHVNGPSAFFRRDLLARIDGFDASLQLSMDWDLWLRFGKSGARFVRINDFLWAQRRWPGSKTQRPLSKEERDRQYVEIDRMLKKNHFRITRGGICLAQFWRLLTGCYFKEWIALGEKRGKLD